jgi:transcriptional regulator with XRE-family HTH domain
LLCEILEMPTRNPKKSERPREDNRLPNVGDILKRLRTRSGLSLEQVARKSGLSQSFLSALERGTSDVSLGRLSKLANVFDHDISSFLGFTARYSQPYRLTDLDRFKVARGKGVRYEALRLPGIDLEIDIMDFEPGSGFDDERAHEGLDVIVVTNNSVILSVAGVDHALDTGECIVYSAGYKHRIRNESKKPSRVIGLTTGRMY